MNLELVIEFNNRRCDTCGSHWAVEVSRSHRNCQCPVCAGDKIAAANERADAAVRSAAASKANVTRKLNRQRS
jgi:hypothetical protein